TADRLGLRTAERRSYRSMSQLLREASALPRDAEGFVVRFEDGLRLKVKGAEYRRIHALVSRITPLALWEAMQAGDDLEAVRRDIPEELWSDFDTIRSLLARRLDAVVDEARRVTQSAAHLSDKEVGLQLARFPAHVRPFIFALRKHGGDLLSGPSRQA